MIIEGNLDLRKSSIESLGELTGVNGKLQLENCHQLKSLGKLKKIKKNLSLNDEIETLGDLEEVCEDLLLQRCGNLKDLGKLKTVNGTIYLKGSGITKKYIEEEKPFLLDKCKWEN